MPVILQYLDDAALAHPSVAALFDHPLQFAAQGLELLDPDFDLLEV